MTAIAAKVLLEREGYRFVERGIIELNGKPDYRLQKQDWHIKCWKDEYLFDNSIQCNLAMEDLEYAKWLCNDACYMDEDDIEWCD
jgi:hypothetical protein